MIFAASSSMYSSGYAAMVSRNERKLIFLIIFFRPFQFPEKQRLQTYKKVLHGILNLTFRMLQHTFSEVAVTKYDKI